MDTKHRPERNTGIEPPPDPPSETLTKGLDVARDFFEQWGLPYLTHQQPHLVDRVAVLICLGSDSLGNDDELSKDHKWGPRFTIIMTGEDMRRHGRQLRDQINQAAPREWKGHSFRYPQVSIEVESLNRYFKRIVGCDHPPRTTRGWRERTQEDNLYMIRHATVFHDPLGEFTNRRQAFWYYPKRVWLERIWEELFNVWHFGQYNFLDRLFHRRDPVATTICLGRFAEGVMRLSLLLARDYSPYWKWLAAEFRKLSDVEPLDSWLIELAEAQDLDTQAEWVRRICDDIHTRLVAQFGLDPDPKGHPHRLHLAHVALTKLKDAEDA